MQNRAFLDPIQKRAPARSVQLEAVYLEALLYIRLDVNMKIWLEIHTMDFDIGIQFFLPFLIPL